MMFTVSVSNIKIKLEQPNKARMQQSIKSKLIKFHEINNRGSIDLSCWATEKRDVLGKQKHKNTTMNNKKTLTNYN